MVEEGRKREGRKRVISESEAGTKGDNRARPGREGKEIRKVR